MTTPDDAHDPAASEETSRPPSRSQQKRDAAAVTALGARLVELSRNQLEALGLPDELLEAILHCQGLKLRARGRQKRLIGQLLRDEDHEAILQRLDTHQRPHREQVEREHRAEAWRARLIEEGDPALQALVEAHPSADRTQLRALARAARQAPEATKTKRASRELLRAVRALLAD